MQPLKTNQAFDFEVEDHGSIVLFTLFSPEVKEWWGENVQPGQTFDGSKAVESRYASDLYRGLIDNGFQTNEEKE